MFKPDRLLGGKTISFLPKGSAPMPYLLRTETTGERVYAIAPQSSEGTYTVEIQNRTAEGAFCKTVFSALVLNTQPADYISATFLPNTPSTSNPKASANCGSIYSFGTNSAEFGIPKNAYEHSISTVYGNANNSLGVFAIYNTRPSVYNYDPEYIGLVDKACDKIGGSASFYTSDRRDVETGIGGKGVLANKSYKMNYVSVPLDNFSPKTYYGRCTLPDQTYCDTQIRIVPGKAGSNRVAETEQQQESTSLCQYSKKQATISLLEGVLCESLSMLKGQERQMLETIKTDLLAKGIILANITDAMISNMAAGKCSEVITALTANITGNESYETLKQNLVNASFSNQLIGDVIDALTENEIIDSDFISRQIETFDGPIDPLNGRVQAIGVCPDYYFTPSGKRILIPDIGNCVVSINGVLMSFERNGKKYIPLYTRSTLAFIGYYEEADFHQKATATGISDVKVLTKDKLNSEKWITSDIVYPAENSNIARFISFIEENKSKPGRVRNYTEANFAEIKALLAQLPETIFENVEGTSSVFLFDLLKIKNSLSKALSTTDAQLAMLTSIFATPETVCTEQSEAICKVYNCVYNQITGNQSRDILNGRIPLETRKKLLTLLAQNTLTSGSVPGGCAFSSNGEGIVVSLLRTTPETDRKAVLDHLYSFAINTSNVTPLKAFISKIDGANFDDFMLILSDWVATQYPSQESWSAILQRQDRAKRALMVLGDWSLGSTLMTSVKDGRTLFDFNITVLGKTPILKPDIDALDYVVVKFTKDFTIGNTTFRTGELYKIPAMLCYLIMNDQKNKSIATTGKYTAYALGAAIGISQIMAATTGVEMTLAIIDMGMLGADFAVNEALATKLNRTQAGKTWLDNFNKFVLFYGVGRGLAELSGLTSEMRASASVLNDEEVTALTFQLTAKVGVLGTFAAKLQANVKFVAGIRDLRHFTTVDDFVVQFEKLHKLAPINSIKSLDDVMSDFDYFITRHLDDLQSGQFKDFMDEMMQTANATQADKFKAAATSLEVIRNPQKYIPAKFNLDKLELEDLISYADDAGDFRFDIKWNALDANGKKVSIFIDTKNYSTASNMFKDLGQYKAYLREINNFDEMYIIQQGGRGFDEKAIIGQLEKAIAKDAEGVFAAKSILFENVGIKTPAQLRAICEGKLLTNYPQITNTLKITIQ